MTEQFEIDDAGVRSIYRRSNEIQAGLCLMEHPVHHVLCLRAIGHPAQHWFTVRWESAAAAIDQAREALREAATDAR